MDMRRAAYAANKFFNFTAIIPCHYRTFLILEQSAQVLIDEVPSARVIEPDVMVPLTLVRGRTAPHPVARVRF